MVEMNIKKLKADATIPTKGSACAAGLDLYAYVERGAVDIPAGATVKIGTGIATEIPDGASALCSQEVVLQQREV